MKNIRQFAGWALIAAAIVRLLALVLGGLMTGVPYVGDFLAILYPILLFLGLPGIQWVQPRTGLWGKIGLVLMALPALDRLIRDITVLLVADPLTPNQMNSSISDFLAKFGILYAGYIIVGWLTIRARIFPGWLGWLLLLLGIVNAVVWFLLPYGVLDSLVPFSVFTVFMISLQWLEVVVLLGYGWHIVQHKFPKKKHARQRAMKTA